MKLSYHSAKWLNLGRNKDGLFHYYCACINVDGAWDYRLVTALWRANVEVPQGFATITSWVAADENTTPSCHTADPTSPNLKLSPIQTFRSFHKQSIRWVFNQNHWQLLFWDGTIWLDKDCVGRMFLTYWAAKWKPTTYSSCSSIYTACVGHLNLLLDTWNIFKWVVNYTLWSIFTLQSVS